MLSEYSFQSAWGSGVETLLSVAGTVRNQMGARRTKKRDEVADKFLILKEQMNGA